MMIVKKRDGSCEEFNENKIKSVIEKALKDDKCSYGGDAVEVVYGKVWIQCDVTTDKDGNEVIPIEAIQDSVEKALMSCGMFDAAKRFIKYRLQHKETRDFVDQIEFIDKYIYSENAATGSKYDQNANVASKNIATLSSEMDKGRHIKINRKLMYNAIRKRFNKGMADRYIYLLENHFIYKNDETSLYPYCASVSLYPWLLDGMKTIGGNSSAPSNLKSFNGGFINLVFTLSSMLSGAVSTPEYLFYLDWFIRKEYGDDYISNLDEVVELSNKKRTLRKNIEDGFEQVVFSLNQPTGARNFQPVK